MKDGSFYVIQSFMINDLKLKPSDAVVYAIIYGFSQDGESTFRGSLGYLVDSTNLARQTVINILKNLVERKLVIKKETYNNGVKSCEYLANLETLRNLKEVSTFKEIGSTNSVPPVQNLDGGSTNSVPLVQNLDGGGTNSVRGVVQNLDGGSTNFVPNNIIYNINNNIEDKRESVEASPTTTPAPDKPKTKKESQEVKHKHGEYQHVLLTDTQYNALVEDYGKAIIDRYIKDIDEWIQLKGNSPYKDFKLAILKWLRKDNVQPMAKQNYANNVSQGSGWWGD